MELYQLKKLFLLKETNFETQRNYLIMKITTCFSDMLSKLLSSFKNHFSFFILTKCRIQFAHFQILPIPLLWYFLFTLHDNLL